MSVYRFSVTTNRGEVQSLSEYKGKVLLIVNTASECGFAPQFRGLQKLYERYREKGFVVLGFPCNQFLRQEPRANDEIANYCELRFGVTFPLFAKIDVKGPDAHPLFRYLTARKRGFLTRDIKWNFTKFLVDRDGEVIKRYAPATTPEKIERDIRRLLNM